MAGSNTASTKDSVKPAQSSGGVLKTPIPAPTATSTAAEKPALTKDQQTKYDALLGKVKGWTEVPSTVEKKAGPLTEDEKFWLTRECLLRYLRAVKWNENEAEKRLLGTLTWRREYGVDGLTGDHISPENETGKQIQLGYDKQGRPCHYLNPGRQNTEFSLRQNQHLVFMLERVIEVMPPNQETLGLLINFKTGKSRSNTAPGISQGREILHILQTHYPERLGRALIINVPFIVSGFFKLITPFIDPLTREKLKFNEDMSQYVPKEQLWSEFGGDLQFEYDHSVYWPAFLNMCAERRAEQKQRWDAGGKQIGEREDFLKGLDAESVAADEPILKVAAEAAALSIKEERVTPPSPELTKKDLEKGKGPVPETEKAAKESTATTEPVKAPAEVADEGVKEAAKEDEKTGEPAKA